ncbi:hypothetical protein L596_020812 [Steinernema carpocapsae]|uniref:Ribosome biogenesis regulatory protein n=1 Tax=Steinernema carpocapsae TaxID=34508 RepID=A0A4U5MUN8_STECR|nr:hypothetical protein L596_020812 [Steinernema carpocapsae]
MSIAVSKLVEPNVDLGNLLIVDRDPLPEEAPEINDEFLLSRTRENAQLLFNKIWELERKTVDNAYCAVLPEPTTRLPREKIIPANREPTKWEKFAAEKGIQKVKKDRKVYDAQSGEWKPTYGYRRANDNTKDWMLEVPENQVDEHLESLVRQLDELDSPGYIMLVCVLTLWIAEDACPLCSPRSHARLLRRTHPGEEDRVGKNELQRLKNIARHVKPTAGEEKEAPIGATTDVEKSKIELDEQIYRAKVGHGVRWQASGSPEEREDEATRKAKRIQVELRRFWWRAKTPHGDLRLALHEEAENRPVALERRHRRPGHR